MQRPLRHVGQPLEREGKVRPPLVPRDGVDLIEDYRTGPAEHGPAPIRGDQEIERLRGRNEEVRRAPQHGGAFRGGRVTSPDGHPDLGRGIPELGGDRTDLAERALEVVADVDSQGLERRDIHDLGAIAKIAALLVRAVDPVDADEKCGQRLARAGGRRYQGVGACRDFRPAARLRRGWPGRKPAFEPCAHGRVERVKHLVRVSAPTDKSARAGAHGEKVSVVLPVPRRATGWDPRPRLAVP